VTLTTGIATSQIGQTSIAQSGPLCAGRRNARQVRLS
jgi:hypothetical protein